MDNWRQERLSDVTRALDLVGKRTSKLVRRINGFSSAGGAIFHQNKQMALLEDEVARLQDMSDRLLDFKGKLFFYSNRAYVDAVEEWERAIEKHAKDFKQSNSRHHEMDQRRA